MKATISLLLAASADPLVSALARAHSAVVLGRQRLPRVERVERKTAVLHAGPMTQDADVLSLNLSWGCAHQCAFCSVRAQPSYPGDEVVYLYADTAKGLKAELAARRRPPRAVYICPATDPFPPLAEVQQETGRVVAVLAEHGVQALLMTRGYIRPSAQGVLAQHQEHVKVTLGLTTLDRQLCRILEPWSAPPRLRLRQIARLQELGIPVRVALEPLVPGVTDTRTNLVALLQGLAAVGVREITAGYMFLRSGIRDNLIGALKPYGWDESVLAEYVGGPTLPSGGVAPAQYLPKRFRQRGYAALMALGSELEIKVRLSRLSNPDFVTSCRPDRVSGLQQRMLPRFQI